MVPKVHQSHDVLPDWQALAVSGTVGGCQTSPAQNKSLVGLLKLTMFIYMFHLCHPAMRKLPQHMQGVYAHRCRRSMTLHLQGASLHALWQLESALLKRFEVPSFQALQLPSGCSSLLSVLAAQDELAAALTGYADAWDCGAVPYESVLRVVQQALASMRHGTRGRSRSATTGE